MSSRHSRTMPIAALVTATAMLAAACGGDTGGGEDGGSGTVRMLVNITDNLTQGKWEELVAPFEEETGIDVQIERPSGQAVAETFPSLLAAGATPDVTESSFPT